MKKHLLLFVVLVAVCCCAGIVYRLAQPPPVALRRAQLDRLLDSGTPIQGVVILDDRNSALFECRGWYEEPGRRAVAFHIKTPWDDALLRKVTVAGLQVHERNHAVARAVSRVLQLTELQ